jgi:ligand-binding sensor domain-containing protein
MFWKIEKEIFGSLPKIQVFIITMGNPFNILQPGRALPIIWFFLFMKIKKAIFGSARRWNKPLRWEIFSKFYSKDGLPHNGGRAIMEDKTGKLWFAQVTEPCFYDGKTFTVLKNKDGKAFKNVWSVIEDKKGNIWFGDVDGLWRYDGSTFTKVSQRGAYAIIEDKKGNIWTTGA